MSDVIVQLVSPIFSGLSVMVILYMFKIPGNIRQSSESNKALISALEGVNRNLTLLNLQIQNLEKRHMVTDRILSDMAQKPIDTAQISHDLSKYPDIPYFIRRDRKKDT